MDAIERIEIAVRSLLATSHAGRYGLFSYANDLNSLPNLNEKDRTKFQKKITEAYDISQDAFVAHFKKKYGDEHRVLPIWMAAEIMTLGTLLTFHRGCHQDIRTEIAKPFGVHETVFASWLLSLNTVRNICAHHGRLWNRDFGTKPKIPDKLPQWREPVQIHGNRAFAVLTICKWCVDRIAPQSEWAARARALIAGAREIPLKSMGFPDAWESSPIWAGTNS